MSTGRARGRNAENDQWQMGRFWGSAGSGTILGLGLVAGILAGLISANIAANWLVSAQKLQSQADLIALAAADSARGLTTGFPCQTAGQMAHIYMVSLDSCRIVGFESFIRLSLAGIGPTLEATSRAGPPTNGN